MGYPQHLWALKGVFEPVVGLNWHPLKAEPGSRPKLQEKPDSFFEETQNKKTSQDFRNLKFCL